MEQSEFDKTTAALDRAEFAMEVVRLRAEEFRRKSDAAKSVEEIADLHLEATEILHQLVKISTAVDTGNPAPHFRLVSDTGQEASTDRRQPPARRRLFKSGKILLGIDPIPCTIRNMSERGACLRVQTTAGIPAIFVFQRAGEPAARTCKTIWRDNTRIGFMFIQPE